MQTERMTWEEYRDEVIRSVAILPVGSLEQHGPHLPLNVDVVIPTNLAMRVAEQINRMVLPSISYSYKSHPSSGGGQLFEGTTSLDGMTLIHLALDILRETHRHGGTRFLIMNGHYENVAFLTEALDLILRDASGSRFLLINWWGQVSDDLVEDIFAEAGFPGWDTEHAGVTETALMQYFAPELVREDKIIDDQSERKPTYSIFPAPEDIIPKSGVLYKATYATQEKGEKLANSSLTGLLK